MPAPSSARRCRPRARRTTPTSSRGPAGSGKAAVARAFAAALLTEGVPDAAGAAARVEHGVHPDLTWVAPGSAAGILVGDVDEAVVAGAARTPFEAPRRVFVIEDADELNDQAANRMLKTLEEPPSFAHLILLTSRPGEVLPTIASRCQAGALRRAVGRGDRRAARAPRRRARDSPTRARGSASATPSRALSLALGRRAGAAGRRRGRRARRAARRDARRGRGWRCSSRRARAGASAGAAVEQALESELEYAIRKDHGRMRREAGERAQARGAAGADGGAATAASRSSGLWLRDVACVVDGAPELVHHTDRVAALREDAARGVARGRAARRAGPRRGHARGVRAEPERGARARRAGLAAGAGARAVAVAASPRAARAKAARTHGPRDRLAGRSHGVSRARFPGYSLDHGAEQGERVVWDDASARSPAVSPCLLSSRCCACSTRTTSARRSTRCRCGRSSPPSGCTSSRSSCAPRRGGCRSRRSRDGRCRAASCIVRTAPRSSRARVQSQAALPARVAMLRRLAGDRAPRPGQIAVADVPIFAVELLLTSVLLVAGVLGGPRRLVDRARGRRVRARRPRRADLAAPALRPPPDRAAASRCSPTAGAAAGCSLLAGGICARDRRADLARARRLRPAAHARRGRLAVRRARRVRAAAGRPGAPGRRDARDARREQRRARRSPRGLVLSATSIARASLALTACCVVVLGSGRDRPEVRLAAVQVESAEAREVPVARAVEVRRARRQQAELAGEARQQQRLLAVVRRVERLDAVEAGVLEARAAPRATSLGCQRSKNGCAQTAMPPAAWIASIASGTVGVARRQ